LSTAGHEPVRACLPNATDQELLSPTRKTYTGPLELGEDLMTIAVGEKIEVRRPGRSLP
jgi:ribonuclease Z